MGIYGPFYMVWVEGNPTPTIQYVLKEDAVKEAIRLAAKERKTVYILKALEAYVIPFPAVEKISLVE